MRAVGVVCRVVENVGTVGVPDGGDEEIGRHIVTSICNLLSATVPRPDGTDLLGRFGGFLFKVFAGDLAGDGDDVVAGFHAEQGNGVFLA